MPQSSVDTYGVTYTPAEQVKLWTAPALTALETHGYRYVRLTWVDLANIVRYRVLPIRYFEKVLASKRPGITTTTLAVGLVFLNVPEGFGAVGEILYTPDMDTLRVATYTEDTATVFGFFEHKTPVPSAFPGPKTGTPGLGLPLCPRGVLKRVCDQASAQGLTFLVGFETEFILLKSTDPITAVNDAGWSVSRALPSGSVEQKVLNDIAETLHEAGIELQMFHAEAAPGQFEVVTGPLTPLEAADALVFTRETIFNVAASHGLRATLAPRVFNDSCGSAAHAHISVHTATPSAPSGTAPAPTLNAAERAFLGAVLSHFPALAALTLPTPASYARVQDGVWSGGTWVSWGTDNREAPVRLCGAGPGNHHFELKLVDGTANPYLALAAVLGVGARGAELEVGDCGERPASEMSEEEREGKGVRERVPRSAGEARERLRADKAVAEVLGEELVKAYLAVNETLEKALEVEAGKVGGDYMRVMVENY